MTGVLQQKVALVTGASSGIGAATARMLAAEGARLVLAARRTDRLATLAAELRDDGAEVLELPLDVTDEPACRAAIEQCLSGYGQLDILINNAGLMLLGPIEDADISDWTRMVHTNVLGLMYLTHAALPHLIRSKGSIVQISSIAGRQVGRGGGVYSATKYAVNAFSESLRLEVTERGVRVVVIEPGTVETELRDHITHAESKAAIEARAAKMRQLQAADVAEAIRFALTVPAHVAVNEVLIRPTDQA
jgi:clavulanate-9-aldehyde reducatase